MKNRYLVNLLIMFVAISLMGCAAPQTNSGKGALYGTGIGAAAGAGLGQAIGGNTESTLIGAGIGALVGGLAGHQIGAYMDRQEAALRQAMAASDAASIRRTQDVLTATFKGDVFFDLNSSILKPGSYTEIGRVANVLNQYPQTTITVAGHTDASGPEDYNQKLSEKRAMSVKNALVQRGVDPARMMTIGYGEAQPISSEPAMNRRVEIVITPIQQG